MNKQFRINNLEELKEVSSFVAKLSETQKHFCFTGEMGAGKTTLINLICKDLGVKEHTSSPTYSIVNEYIGKKKVINHFDLFRIKNEMELLDIGIEEILDSETICFIEWPEKVMDFLPNSCVNIVLEVEDDIRKIMVTCC